MGKLVYEDPDLTPAQRNQVWLELEAKYRPWRDYEVQRILINPLRDHFPDLLHTSRVIRDLHPRAPGQILKGCAYP